MRKKKNREAGVESSVDLPAERRLFYRAASRFAEAQPWRAVSDAQVLGIDLPAHGVSGGCAVVTGMAGRSFGLVLLRSLDDHLRFVRASNQTPPEDPGVSLFTVSFDWPRSLPAGQQIELEARAAGYAPGSFGLVPSVVRVDASEGHRAASADDHRLAASLLDAVRQFVAEQRKLFSAPPEASVAISVQVEGLHGKEPATVTVPPPNAPWQWGREQPIDGLRRQERGEVGEALAAARRAEGIADEEAGLDGRAAAEMMLFLQARSLGLAALTPELLEQFLLRHYPAEGQRVGAGVATLPDRFDAVLRWLGTTGRGPAQGVEALRERLAALRERFVEAANDPRRFGSRKKLALAMHGAGVDAKDPAAVSAFMGELRRQAAENPRLLRQFAPQAARWTWDGQGQPPDPQTACPCGSGRRYRKCCMPR